MSGGELNGNGNGNGKAAQMREIALSQIVWAVSVLGGVCAVLWAVFTWSQSVQSSWQQPIAEMRQALAQTQALLDGQREIVSTQQQTLSKLVDFMNEQTMARRAAGERESLRRELCLAGQLKGPLCANMPSETQIEALRR